MFERPNNHARVTLKLASAAVVGDMSMGKDEDSPLNREIGRAYILTYR